jgi:DNA-binding MarR family transcriptional regulator
MNGHRSPGDPTGGTSDHFVELARVIGATLAKLKQSGPPPLQLRGIFEEFSLGPRHVPALMALTLGGPLSVGDLARELGHTLPTTSTIVGELSRAGLVDRAEDDHDRRRTIVQVHGDHAEAITAWAHQALAPLHATLQQLSPQAREHFVAGWHILYEETVRSADAAAVDG